MVTDTVWIGALLGWDDDLSTEKLSTGIRFYILKVQRFMVEIALMVQQVTNLIATDRGTNDTERGPNLTCWGTSVTMWGSSSAFPRCSVMTVVADPPLRRLAPCVALS